MAQALAAEGASIVINARSSQREAQAVVADLEAMGCSAMAYLADVTDETAVAGMVDAAEEVAGMVLALCLPSGRFITGQAVHVNGGMYMP